MKKLKLMLASVAAAALLTACGGGGGGGSETATATPSSTPSNATTTTTTTSPAASVITVAPMSAPNVSTSDCPRLTSEASAIAALDLSNASIKAVNDFLTQVDPDHAYKVFIRRPYDFVNWIASIGDTVNVLTAGVATHETLHMTDSVLRNCGTAGYKILFFGNILDTGLQAGDTATIKIVDAVIDPALKTEPRFTTYITNAAAGNDFTALLDELAAYTGAAHTEFAMLSKGKNGGTTGSLDADLGGAVNFMVYLENHLRAARLNDTATYDKIRSSGPTKTAIQALWTAAEQALRDSYPYVKGGTDPRLVINSAYFSAAYSASLLSELDFIGITHSTAASWSGTYLP
jgi:hypothetical protein